MYIEESLREELIAKLEKEQKEYLDDLKEKGVDEVIKNVYEINARQEILDYIAYGNFDLKDVKALIKTNHILSRRYDEWLIFDGNFYEALQYPIDKEIERISDEFYSKDDKEAEQKEKPLKNKNMGFEKLRNWFPDLVQMKLKK